MPSFSFPQRCLCHHDTLKDERGLCWKCEIEQQAREVKYRSIQEIMDRDPSQFTYMERSLNAVRLGLPRPLLLPGTRL